MQQCKWPFTNYQSYYKMEVTQLLLTFVPPPKRSHSVMSCMSRIILAIWKINSFLTLGMLYCNSAGTKGLWWSPINEHNRSNWLICTRLLSYPQDVSVSKPDSTTTYNLTYDFCRTTAVQNICIRRQDRMILNKWVLFCSSSVLKLKPRSKQIQTKDKVFINPEKKKHQSH